MHHHNYFLFEYSNSTRHFENIVRIDERAEHLKWTELLRIQDPIVYPRHNASTVFKTQPNTVRRGVLQLHRLHIDHYLHILFDVDRVTQCRS